jgi:hypothetical protein
VAPGVPGDAQQPPAGPLPQGFAAPPFVLPSAEMKVATVTKGWRLTVSLWDFWLVPGRSPRPGDSHGHLPGLSVGPCSSLTRPPPVHER